MTTEERQGPTPNGGVRSVIIYSDDKGNLVDRAVATRAEIIEYDAAGRVVMRTYGTFEAPGDSPPLDKSPTPIP